MQHGILHKEGPGRPRIIPGHLRANQLAKRLEIKPYWIYDRIRNGTIRVEKNEKYNTYLFPDHSGTLEQFKQLVSGTVKTLAF